MSWIVWNRKRRISRRNHQYTVCHGGKSFGSIRQPPPERAMYRIASRIVRRSAVGLRPRRGGLGSSGRIRSHSSSVRSVGQRFARLSNFAIRLRAPSVHIPILNHANAGRGILFSNGLSGAATMPHCGRRTK